MLQLVTPWQLLVVALNHSSGEDAKGLGRERQWPAPLPVSSIGIHHQAQHKSAKTAVQEHQALQDTLAAWGPQTCNIDMQHNKDSHDGCISNTVAALSTTGTMRPPMAHNDFKLDHFSPRQLGKPQAAWLKQARMNQFLPGCNPDLGLGKLA